MPEKGEWKAHACDNACLRQLTVRRSASKVIIAGMIGWFRALLLLTAAMSAQNIEVPKVRIFFPENHFEKASMSYALQGRSRDFYYHHFGVSMSSGGSLFEIRAATDRFKALVWAPGCKMMEFDVPVGRTDVELQFVPQLMCAVIFGMTILLE
jgi:hypothetical protein